MHGGLNGIIHACEDSRSHETQLAVTGQPLRVLVPSHLTGVRDPFDGLREAQFTSLRRHGVFRRVGRRGCDCLGEPKTVRANIAGGYRGDCIAVGQVVEANAHTHHLECIGLRLRLCCFGRCSAPGRLP
jgi:hypothetical protein